MNGEGEDKEQIPRDASVEDLLQAGQAAFDGGDRSSAHELWRAAAVADPYDERVWLAMLKVLTGDEDREVCLENIIAINPLNTESRRELRAIRRKRRTLEEKQAAVTDAASATSRARVKKTSAKKTSTTTIVAPRQTPAPKPRRSLGRTLMRGLAFGLVGILIGVVASIVVYGGILLRAAP